MGDDTGVIDAFRSAVESRNATALRTVLELEKAWRDAEEIAGIADDLTVPDSVQTDLDRMRRG